MSSAGTSLLSLKFHQWAITTFCKKCNGWSILGPAQNLSSQHERTPFTLNLHDHGHFCFKVSLQSQPQI